MKNKIKLTDKEKWKIMRPYLVEIVLLLTDYIFNKDEKYKSEE